MTATLTFNLPEEEQEHQLAIDAWKWKSVVVDLSIDVIREKLKYGHNFSSPDEVLEFVRQSIIDLAREKNLSFD